LSENKFYFLFFRLFFDGIYPDKKISIAMTLIFLFILTDLY